MKFGLSTRTMEIVDWDSIQASNIKLSPTERATRSKYVYRWSYTNKRDHCFNDGRPDTCPLCKKEEEEQHHVQCCKDPGATEHRAGLRDELEDDLTRLRTHPDLTTLLLRSMDVIKHQKIVVDVTGHENEGDFRQLFVEQAEIGWENVRLGLLTKKWRGIQ